jgi:DNA-binding transcriptional LysR family regulator
MNFVNLKYFLTVTEEMNITRAAKHLYISQQSLSSHIAALEKELDIQLFERTPVFKLTYAGSRLAKFARKILDLERQIYSEMDDIAGHRRGQLRIGVSHTCGRAILPQILPSFHQRNELISLTVTEGNSAELEELLRLGHIDLMMVFTPVVMESVEVIPLAVERLLLLVPKKLSRELFGERSEYMRGKCSISADIAAFQELPFILLKKGNRVRSMIDEYTSSKGVSLNILFETENTETAYALAKNDMGVAIYPDLFLKYIHGNEQREDDTIDYFPLNDEATTGTLAICYDRRRYLSNAAGDFIECARQALRE